MENIAMMPVINTLRFIMFGAMLCCTTTVFAQPPVVIKTYGQHIGGNVVYTQEITNIGDRNIADIAVGYDTDYVSLNQPSTRDTGELKVFPLGSSVSNREIAPSSVSGPSGWTAEIIQIEHSGQYFVWRGPTYPEPAILPGQTATFRITVPKYDAVYLTGHFVAYHADSKEPEVYSGVMEKLDTTPPTLTVTVIPTRLQAAAGKLVTVTATITVNDDHDPAPEIKLESITANEPLAAGDIAGATTGTDDREFQLRDVKVPSGTVGRVYTITYSATDASGNKATASAMVGVK
jgi:hypothetical protein